MNLTDEQRKTLVSLQIQKAHNHLAQADKMLELGYYDLSANRYYYACYHAIQALMIKNGLVCHTHTGLIGEFGKNFIKTGIFDIEYGRFVTRLQQLREKGDYNCYYDISQEDASTMQIPAHNLISLIVDQLGEI